MKTIGRDSALEPTFGRPHLVILGAGASLQAFPNGDKHGRQLPLMNNLVEVVGLHGVLDKAKVRGDRTNFEKLFSRLCRSPKHAATVRQIEQIVFDYFSRLELPDAPTIYDHLVISLREKDVIATFNWDPFLVQAMVRNSDRVQSRPQCIFLHGNTATGHCIRHKKYVLGVRGRNCGHCGKPLRDSKLLYPVEKKQYSRTRFLGKQWRELRRVLGEALVLTIFGYSAPESDREAVALMMRAWGDPSQRELEEIELIDIKNEDQLHVTWRPFIHSHHFQTTASYYDSMIAARPRRSCEALWSGMMDLEPVEPNPLPMNADWEELYAWLDPLIVSEMEH